MKTDEARTSLFIWSEEMKQAEAIFRGAGREDFAKGIAYARKTAVRFLTRPEAGQQGSPAQSRHQESLP